MISNHILIWVFLAIFIEGAIQWFKKDFRKNRWNALSLLFGISFAVVTDFNLLSFVGYAPPNWMPYSVFLVVSYFVGGVVLARGSNYFNDIIDAFGSLAGRSNENEK